LVIIIISLSFISQLKKHLLTIALLFPLLIGCSSDSGKNQPVLFETKEQAEKAAKNFNCSGSHKMGDKWMPCKSHEAHEGQKQGNGHGHHHHHDH